MLKRSIHFSRRKSSGVTCDIILVGASQLPDLITSVQRGLSEVGRPSPSEEVLTPAVTVQADREAVKLDRAAQLPSGWPEGKHSNG